MTTLRIAVDDVQLNVEVDGEGPALVLVNGAACTTRQWDGAIERLAAERTVVRHDVRGTGSSSPGPLSGYTFERYARDIVAIADHLGLEVFDLWGMAWGARVALVTAAQHADRVRRLVLSDFSIDPADLDAQKRGGADAKAARAAAGLVDPPIPPGVREHLDPDAMQAAMAATLLHSDLLPFVEQVTAPTLIATGEYDPNLVSSRRAVSSLATAQLVELELTGHGSVLFRPDPVIDAVLAFLDE
ncbi:MAG: alpha/beta fold hydrolase [Acidimicrobiales bacterium]|nr:MAG: alpha/beta fold hydrolase [Acidimicrobiales bacterium]